MIFNKNRVEINGIIIFASLISIKTLVKGIDLGLRHKDEETQQAYANDSLKHTKESSSYMR